MIVLRNKNYSSCGVKYYQKEFGVLDWVKGKLGFGGQVPPAPQIPVENPAPTTVPNNPVTNPSVPRPKKNYRKGKFKSRRS